jgi:exosortase/archaeosortase family protein
MRMRKFSEKQLRLLDVAEFLLVFNLLAIPMYAILLTDASFPPLQEFLASAVTYALNNQGISAVASGTFISIVDAQNAIRSVQVSFDSTGWKSLYALAALVIATPIPNFRNKLKFLAFGLPGIFTLNFLRIWSTLWYSVVFGWQNFDVIHLFLWREGLIAVVLLFWFFWLRDAMKLAASRRGKRENLFLKLMKFAK